MRISWRLLALVLFLVQSLCAAGQPINPHINATVLLEDAEKRVKDVAVFGLQNYRDAEALSATCDNGYNCSRSVCAPLRRDLSELKCEMAPTNPYCVGDDNITCRTLQVSRKRSYIRWQPDANLLTENPECDMKSAICAQRKLDEQIFLRPNQTGVIDFTVQSFLYFGSTSGIFRIYPGRELTLDSCNTFELLARPWFASAWAVEKDVVVLLDAGPEMGLPLSLKIPDPSFDAARNITLRLMTTLCRGDTISVIPFNESAAVPLEPKIDVSTTVVEKDSLLELTAQINNVPTPDTNARKANLTAALISGRARFSNTSQMKVFIILTNGEMLGPEDLKQDLLDSLNATVFMYRLLSKEGGDLVSTILKNASCHLNGWYEEGVYRRSSPLTTLQSYFSYMAQLRFNTSREPYWIPRYIPFSGIGEVITVAYPVFNGSFLVGVAGQDFLVDNLDIVSDNVDDLVSNRNTISSLKVTNPPRLQCGQTLSQSVCTSDLSTVAVTGLCTSDRLETNTTEQFQARVCCGDCPASDSDGPNKAAVIGGVLAGLVSAILVTGACVWWFGCPMKPNKRAVPSWPSPGRSDEVL